MRSSQVKAIFLALAVLSLLYAAVQLLSGDEQSAGGDDIAGAVHGGLELIRVVGPEPSDSLRLEDRDGTWTVNGYPADTAAIRRLAAGLESARVGRLVARSASNHARLGVLEDSARLVEIGPAGSPDVVFLLGGAGADGRYVRFPPSDDVFSVPAASVRLLLRPLEEWRNRIVASVDTAAVGRISVSRGDQEGLVVLKRDTADPAGAWSLDGTTADSAVVAGLLQESATLEATGFPSDSVAFAVDFSSPAATLEMYDSDEPGAAPALSLLFLTSPDARDFLVRRADDPLAYRISAAQAERLLPTRSMLEGSE
jgi:Domain of unknown function (DUF4340)